MTFEPRGWRVVRFRGPDGEARVGAVDPPSTDRRARFARPTGRDQARLDRGALKGRVEAIAQDRTCDTEVVAVYQDS